MSWRRAEADDLVEARTRRAIAQEPTVESPVRTIHLCPATTKRPTTLLAAINRSVAELNRAGYTRRPVVLPDRFSATV
jgi:hypothetical protein